MKKIAAYILILAMLLTAVLPVNAAAETNQSTGESVSGKYAENCTWVFEDGVLTVSGIGGTRVNNQYDEVSRNLEIKELVVESGVLFVHDNFCFRWPYLEKVTIGDTVESLGENCFAYCPKLKEVNLPSTLKGIHAGCFEGSGIEEIVIPEGVEFLGRSAFADCQELTTVTLPDSHIRIGNDCFARCPKLKTLQLPEGLEYLPDNAFSGSGLVEIEIPPKVKKLLNGTFGECNDLEKIVIPPSVSEMRTCGLHTCENVTIYCWENTAAHLYALERGVPYVLMEEPPEGDVYDITLVSNDLGTVKIPSLRTTAGSKISVEAVPDSDTVMPFIEVYYFSEEELDIQLEQVDET